MVNNFFQSSQVQNPVVSSVMKQQGWDKMKNLKSVLDSRKSAKGTSGTRPVAKPRRPSGEPHQMNMNIQNQKTNRKSSQDGKTRPPSQSSKNSGKAGGKPRLPMQNLAKQRANPMITLTGGGIKSTKRQGLGKKQGSEPSSTSNVSDSDRAREQLEVEQPDNEYLETMKLRMRGLPDLTKSANTGQATPVQSYDQLDSMDTQEIINRANEAILAKKVQTLTTGGHSSLGKDKEKLQNSAGGKGYSLRALKRREDADKKKESVETNAPLSTSIPIVTGHRPDSFGQSKSMLTLQHETTQEDGYDQSVEMIDEMFGGAEFDDQRKQTLEVDRQGQHLPSRKPKFLMSKLSNLMRDTKSSANRNRNRGQVASPFGQTLATGMQGQGPSFLSSDEQIPAGRKSPSKLGALKPQSPKRRQQSPLQKSKSTVTRSTQNLQGIINLKSTPTKFDQINEIIQDGDELLEQIKEKKGLVLGDRSMSMKLTFYEQVPDEQQLDAAAHEGKIAAHYADIPVTDSPTQVTLEGISGMVVMDAKAVRASEDKDEDDEDQKNEADADGMLPYDEDDIRKGQSGVASSSSSSDPLNTTDAQEEDILADGQENDLPGQQRPSNAVKTTLDLDSIRIDEKELHEISKSSREQQEKRTSKHNEFNCELMTIIGNINSRAKELKTKFSINTSQVNQQNEGGLEAMTPGAEISLDQAQTIQMIDMQGESLSYSQRSKRANTNRTGGHRRMLTDDRSSANAEDDDPLKAVALDLSSEANDLDEKSINDNIPKKYSNLDQTIIIGEMEEGNIFDDLKMSKSGTEVGDKSSDLNRQNSQFTDLELERLKDKNDDDKTITISIEDLQELVDNMRLKHRAEIDAIMTEQGAYKRIVQGLIVKLKQQQQIINQQDVKILSLQQFELQAQKFSEYNSKLQTELEFYRKQCDKFKIAIIEYDRHVRESVIQANEFHIQQLETENAHLRKLLNIPEELFKVDPEEEKKKEAQKKKGMLLSIDEKLKAAEKKIAKKQTAQELYYQQHKQHGFDPFDLDQEEYDMYRLSKLKDYGDMPKEMKGQLQGKIHAKMEERSYREELRRHQEKEILQEFARVYGYDVHKHQPDPNGGEIDVEYLQAYIAECRAKEEKLAERMEAEKSLAKQKEALKGKVAAVTKQKPASTNNTGTKSSAPAVKKQLTVETEPDLTSGSSASSSSLSSSGASDSVQLSEPGLGPSSGEMKSRDEARSALSDEPIDLGGSLKAGETAGEGLAGTAEEDQNARSSSGSEPSSGSYNTNAPLSSELDQKEDDDFARDSAEGQPMTREQLEEESSDSVANVAARKVRPAGEDEDGGGDESIAHHEQMSATLSQQSLQEMLKSVDREEEPLEEEGSPEMDDGGPCAATVADDQADYEADGAGRADSEPEKSLIPSEATEHLTEQVQESHGKDDDLGDAPEHKEPESDDQTFDPYESSLSQTFKAGQKGEALDFGDAGKASPQRDDEEFDDDDDDGREEEDDGSGEHSDQKADASTSAETPDKNEDKDKTSSSPEKE